MKRSEVPGKSGFRRDFMHGILPEIPFAALYIGAMSARKGKRQAMTEVVFLSSDMETAIAALEEELVSTWPLEEGWKHHQATIVPAPAELVDALIAHSMSGKLTVGKEERRSFTASLARE